MQISDAEPAIRRLLAVLEATVGGREPLQVGHGEERRFLEDRDEVLMRARNSSGVCLDRFGECRGTIQPAPARG